LADINVLSTRLSGRVQDNEYPIIPAEYTAEIEDSIALLGYEPETLPKTLEPIVLKKAMVNLYYILAGKHAKNYRVRIEGDMEIHSQQVAENYLKLALELEKGLERDIEKHTESIEMIEASRWRVSDNRNTPPSEGGIL
jgi:hypothetical protein